MKASLALATVMLLLGAGCATTVRRTAEQLLQRAARQRPVRRTVEQSPAICGFLGADVCDQLTPGEREHAGGLRYVNPKGTFTQYDKVMIVVVGFFVHLGDKRQLVRVL